MLVQIVSLGGGVAVVGSRDIMAVSRAWGHSFSGLRRLHYSLRPVSFCGSWAHHPLKCEPIVQQSPVSPRHVRFIAHAAALEDSSDLHHKRGLRLSRAERYALVENFVQRHKEAHEGKWPSVNAIVKELGGSRLIVKDIVEELEKNATHRDGDQSPNTEINGGPHVSSGAVGLAADDYIDDEKYQEEDEEEEATKTSKSHSEGLLTEQTVVTNGETESMSNPSESQSGEVEADPGLWRRLRDLGQHERQSEPISSVADLDDDYDDEDEDDEDEEDDDDDDQSLDYNYKEGRQVGRSENQTKSVGSKPRSDSYTGDNFGMFIRFLPLAATEADLRAAFEDCGEIVRAQAMVPKGTALKFTYGFVDFTTPEALAKALKKDKVFIKGSTILTEACSGSRRTENRSSRKLASEHSKKSETYRTSDRNSDARIANGTRRFKSPTGRENGSKTSSNDTYLVAVEGLPYPMPISAVEKMLSAHGSVSRSELAREEGGTYSAHIEFKTEEARDSALASHRVYLGGRWCRITTGEPILTTVVRLSNIGNASENVVLQKCGKVGRVDNIVQRKEGVVDVYYHPSERRNMRKILDRLGDINADFKRWHANLAPKCTLEEIRNSAEIQDWVEVQKDKLLDNLTGAMKSMLIDLEDLRELIDAERRDLPNTGKSRRVER
ncbi:unnamed protein product [Calypogeia fissa]